MTKRWIYVITIATAAGILFAGSNDHAFALCKQGTPHCTPVGQTNISRFKNTVGNAGDCVGTTNETCGYHTGMAARTTPQHSFGTSHLAGGIHR
jgi:hypothetical protein